MMSGIPNSINTDDEMSQPRSHSVSGIQSNESLSHQGIVDKNMYSSISGENSTTNDVQLKYENDRLKLALAQSSANERKLEIEVAKLTRDLQESIANADELKRQLDTYKEEIMQLKTKFQGDLENSKGSLVPKVNLPLRSADVEPTMKEEHSMETKDEDQQTEFDKRPGTTGALSGTKYEIKLAMLFLLQGKVTKEIENFYLASNMVGAGDFDDIVFKYIYNENEVKKAINIFLQAKHKEGTKSFNFNSLFPKQRIKSEFDLRKYLRSYKVIKQQFETNRNHPIFENEFDNSNYIIFTNTSFDFNNCKEDVEEYEGGQEKFFNLKNDAHYYKIKHSHKVMGALRESPDSNMHDEDAGIGEFLNKLRIFDSQFNEKELEEEISKIIESNYSVDKSEAALIFFEVYREVETWWQSEKTHFITEKNMFFESAKEKVSKRSLDVLASLGRAQMNALKLQFEEHHVKKMKELIDENQILNIVTKIATFTNAKVYQALENMTKYKSKEFEENDYKYLFVSFELTTNIQNKIINTFKNTQFNLLVFGCECNKYNFKNFYDKLFHIIKNDDNKKIIMIGQENKRDTLFDGMVCEYQKYEDAEILSDLTDKSQEELINNVKAIFQGEEVILSKLLKDKEMRKLINNAILPEMVNTLTVNIGESLKNLGEIAKYYINRIFNHQVTIRADFKNESIFFVTMNSQIETETIIKSNEEIVLISDIEDDFYKICTNENYKSKNIHRLKEEDGVFTWQQSQGCLSNLCNFIDTEITNSVEEGDMININDKLVIISAEPGMGKSTVLTKVAKQIKNSDPFSWVQTINLNDHTDYLQNMDLNQDKKEEAIEKLLKIVKPKSGLDAELLKRRIIEEGKIILLFDGFDEISPIYDNKLLQLLNVLKDTKAEKLWVTTRPHLRSKLEDKFGVIAYTLKPLTRQNQVTFLKNVWNERLKLNIDLDNRSDSFICELLDLLKESISDRELLFTGIPLQTRMLSEVFQDKFKEFYVSKGKESNIPERLDLVDLYKKFIDKKCIIFFEEKNGVTLSKPAIKKQYENEFFPRFLRNHKILGVDLILHEENEFLSKDEQNILKKIKNDFIKEDDKTGIVIQILNDKPIFIHRTFAEYFVALWFADKVEENNKEIENISFEHIFRKKYEVIKNFFDRILAKEDCKVHNVVLNNDESKVKLLLDDVNIFDKGGRTALHLAASYGYENILKILLENSKKERSMFNNKINTKDNLFDWSALTYAVKCKHWNIVELLLKNGANSDDMFASNSGSIERKNDVTERIVTLIHLAAEKGYIKLVEVILNRKDSYDIDYKNKRYETPLYTAVINEQIEIVKLLVDNGANINENGATNWSVLNFAVCKGNKEIVEFLIKNGAHTDAENNDETPLYLAVQGEKIEIAKMLVENGANINATNRNNRWSILHIAAKQGNKEIVEFLINKGADTNAVEKKGCTPLFVSVEYDKIEIVKLLVENGANINATNRKNSESILHIAAWKGNKEILEFLINKGADTNAVEKNGCTPLFVAVEYDEIEIVKLLVDNGANINAKKKKNWSILHMAAFKDNKEIVEFLINKGADTNAVENNGCTPLFVAVEFDKIESVKLLVDNGANINAKNKVNWSILHKATEVGNKEIIEFLINKGADTNTVEKNGCTPMFVAVEFDKIDGVKLLVDNGADIHARNKMNWSILHKAAQVGNKEIVEFLINKGADTSAIEKNGCTPLFVAVEFDKIEAFKLLVDNGANINAKNGGDWSILHKAAEIGNKKIVEYLINNGTDTNAVERNGYTPLFYAAINNKIESAKLLLDNGANVNTKDKVNCSILHLVCLKANSYSQLFNKEIVELLINKGADTNAVDWRDRTPLYYAVENQKIAVVKLLVDNGANINVKNGGNLSILDIAAEIGNKQILEFLIERS